MKTRCGEFAGNMKNVARSGTRVLYRMFVIYLPVCVRGCAQRAGQRNTPINPSSTPDRRLSLSPDLSQHSESEARLTRGAALSFLYNVKNTSGNNCCWLLRSDLHACVVIPQPIAKRVCSFTQMMVTRVLRTNNPSRGVRELH